MTKNEQKVRIHLRTKQEQAGQATLYNQKFQGLLNQVGQKTYLRYQEEGQEQASVTLKISEEEVLLTRKQDNLRLQLLLTLGEKQVASYTTAYGKIPLLAQTQKLEVEVDHETSLGKVLADYQLYSGQELLGDYKLRLHFKA